MASRWTPPTRSISPTPCRSWRGGPGIASTISSTPPPAVSPLIDAGDPAIADPDGSVSDIGAFGGPHTDPALHADEDLDGAGFLRDCDDDDAANSPDNTEICDSVDNDCDGLIDDSDSSTDPNTQSSWFPDCDGDGQGSALASALVQCLEPHTDPCTSGGVWVSAESIGMLANADCDDEDDGTYLYADETCDPGDQNCDGDDDAGAIDSNEYWLDSDGDGFGAGSTEASCEPTAPSGYSTDGSDCDDASAERFPGAPDVCGDNIDQDCDGMDGQSATVITWYQDADGDGFGDPSASVLSCGDAYEGYVTIATDCDDRDASIHPGGSEACNDLDDDCDQQVDEDNVCTKSEGENKGVNEERGCGCSGSSTTPSVAPWLFTLALSIRRSCGATEKRR